VSYVVNFILIARCFVQSIEYCDFKKILELRTYCFSVYRFNNLIVYSFSSVLRHCWLGSKNGM